MFLLLLLLAASVETSAVDVPDFAKLRVAELRHLLAERGQTCDSCTEKAELVARVAETYHLPVAKRVPPTEKSRGSASGKPDLDSFFSDPAKMASLNKLFGGNTEGLKAQMQAAMDSADGTYTPSGKEAKARPSQEL